MTALPVLVVVRRSQANAAASHNCRARVCGQSGLASRGSQVGFRKSGFAGLSRSPPDNCLLSLWREALSGKLLAVSVENILQVRW